MKTMFELEMESAEGFRNAVLTPEQKAMVERMRAERKADEALHMAIETGVQEEEEEEEEEEDSEEE